MMFKTAIVVVLFSAISLTSGWFCRSLSSKYPYFGTKTFYKDVRGELPSISQRPQGCVPIFINMIVRHGARYPAQNVRASFLRLQQFVETLNTNGNAVQCPSELKALENWKVWMSEFDNLNQTEFGDEEVRQVARAFKQRFPELLGKSVRHDLFRFTSTDTNRTSRSLRAFAEELICRNGFPLPESIKIEVTPKPRDPLLRESCPKFIKEVKDNPDASAELRRFQRSYRIRGIARNVARRLGVKESRVTTKVLFEMYDACYYQRWVDAVAGPWCTIFKTSELEVLDYATDVYNYPQQGFLYPIATQKTCFHTKEIINSLKLAGEYDQEGKEYIKARIRVGHVSQVVSLAGNMGLFTVDDPPTLRNFRSQGNRFFRISKLIPSAGNLAFILYRCGEVPEGQCASLSNYKVQIFWNEKLVTTNPACENGSLCSLDKMLNHYERFVAGSPNECNQDKLCEV